MSRVFATLLLALMCSVVSAQTSNPPATNPTSQDSTSQQSQPPSPPTPPDVVMPDLATTPAPEEKKKSALRRKLEQLDPNCMNIIFHVCWSSPPAPEPKPADKGLDPEYLKDMDVGSFYLEEKKNYMGAMMRFRDALAHKADDPPATFKLAESLEGLKQIDEARDDYQTYLKLDPKGQFAAQASKALERLQGKGAVGSKQPDKNSH